MSKLFALFVAILSISACATTPAITATPPVAATATVTSQEQDQAVALQVLGWVQTGVREDDGHVLAVECLSGVGIPAVGMARSTLIARGRAAVMNYADSHGIVVSDAEMSNSAVANDTLCIEVTGNKSGPIRL